MKLKISIILTVGLLVYAFVTYDFGATHSEQASQPVASSAKFSTTDTETEKYVFLQQLRSIHIGSLEPVLDRYWEWNLLPRSARYLAKLAPAMDAIRADIVVKYGQDAANDPVFFEVFFPLEGQFDFMSSDQQIAVQRYQLELQKTFGRADAAAQNSQLQLIEKLESELGADAFFEYQLRVSPLSHQLRNARAILDENAFRQVYIAMLGAGLHEQIRRPEKLVEFFAELRTMTDDQNALQIRGLFDKDVMGLKQFAIDNFIQPSQLLDILDIFSRSSAELFALGDLKEASTERIQQISIIITERNKSLGKIVGVEFVDKLIQTRGAGHTRRTRSEGRS